MYEVLEHTADIGFRARGATIETLFVAAAEALAGMAVEAEAVVPHESYALEATGEDSEALLVNWLSEVLYLLDGRRISVRRFEVSELSAGRVRGVAYGEPWDAERHRARLVIKGVTYHQLKLAQGADGWMAEVYLDI